MCLARAQNPAKEHEMAKVTVIIPVYNTSRYLEECVDSVRGQTLRDVEIICVNDKSTDDSGAKLAKIANEDPRIRVITLEKNVGLGPARNVGIEASHGEYVLFLDSDDRLRLDAVRRLYDKAESDNLDILFFCAMSFFDSKDVQVSHGTYDGYYRMTSDRAAPKSGADMFCDLVESDEYRASACMQLIRREHLLSNSLRFLPIVHEDEPFTLKSILAAKRVARVNDEFYERRVRDGSIMTTPAFRNILGKAYAAKEITQFAWGAALDGKSATAVSCVLTSMAAGFYRSFRALPDAEKNRVSELHPIDRAWFEIMKGGSSAEYELLKNSLSCRIGFFVTAPLRYFMRLLGVR